MQSEEPAIIQSLEDHLAEYGHTTVGQDIAAAILVIRDLHQKAALSAAEPDKLYSADALMNDGGDNRQTAAEEVLTYLLIEVLGAPDDVPYSANRAGVLIEERLKQQPAPSVAVKALTVDALKKYFASLDAGDIAWSDMPTALYTYLLMDGYVPEDGARQAIRSALSAQVQDAEELNEEMSLAVALDFADNPRPYHTLQAPADTNGELYRALKAIAAAYRSAQVQDVAGLESNPVTLRWWCQQLLDIIENHDITHDSCDEEIAMLNDIRASVDPAAPAKQEGGTNE